MQKLTNPRILKKKISNNEQGTLNGEVKEKERPVSFEPRTRRVRRLLNKNESKAGAYNSSGLDHGLWCLCGHARP